MADHENPGTSDIVLEMDTSSDTENMIGLDDEYATAFAKACGTKLEDWSEVIAGVQFMANILGSIDETANRFGMSKKAFKQYCSIHGVHHQG
jgi:hypothetical protein